MLLLLLLFGQRERNSKYLHKQSSWLRVPYAILHFMSELMFAAAAFQVKIVLRLQSRVTLKRLN